jgi:D-aminopeptidase
VVAALAGDVVADKLTTADKNGRPRAREAGLVVGVPSSGQHNSITDVAGVRVGHTTLIEGADVRTGVTAVLPHNGNLFREKVPAAVFVGNGFGKLMGSTNVPRVADALLDYMLALPGNEDVRSINPVVAETNDGTLNDIRGRHVKREHVQAAIKGARDGPVEEGSVGAGTGTIAFGFKGGIGTSSRRLPARLGGYTVGVLCHGFDEVSEQPVRRLNGKLPGLQLAHRISR